MIINNQVYKKLLDLFSSCRMYDTDGSGSIDFTEFMILFHIMSDGTPDEVILLSNSSSNII